MRYSLPNIIYKWLRFLGILICIFIFSPQQGKTQTDTVTVVDEVKNDTDETVDQEIDKIYFREKTGYDSPTFIPRHLPASQLKKLKEDDNFWYANSAPKKEKEFTPIGQQSWVQVLLWVIIIGVFAAGLMWWLAGSNVGLFRKKNVNMASGEETGDMPEDIFAINYQKEIDKAATAGNFRLAVRLLYLRLLKNLSDKNIIGYKQDKTNFDYLLQLHPTPYYDKFFRLTRHYEYSWYGHFEVSNDAYSKIKHAFDQLDGDIKNK